MTNKRKTASKSSKEAATAAVGSGQAGAKSTGRGANRPSLFQGFPLTLLCNDDNKWKKTFSSRIEELVPGRVLVMHNLLTTRECEAWIDFCESSEGFEYTQHPATKYVAHRECYRMQQQNATVLAGKIYHRIQASGCLPLIQREMKQLYHSQYPPSYQPVGCNSNLRIYKYTQGHSFGKHVDGSNIVEDMGVTEWTTLIYLSECQGGATRFYTDSSSRKRPKSVAFDPRPGSILLHLHGDHCLEHEADPVLNGCKYVLRTDLVFGDSNLQA